MEKRKGLCVFLLGGVAFSAGVAAVLFPAAAPYRAYSVVLGAALAPAGAAAAVRRAAHAPPDAGGPCALSGLAAGLREFAARRTAAAARGATEMMDAAALGRIVYMQAKIHTQMLANSAVCSPPAHIGCMNALAAAYAVNFSLAASYLERYLPARQTNVVMRQAYRLLLDEYGSRAGDAVREYAARAPESLRRAGATETGKRYPARAFELELTRLAARFLDGGAGLFCQRELREQVAALDTAGIPAARLSPVRARSGRTGPVPGVSLFYIERGGRIAG